MQDKIKVLFKDNNGYEQGSRLIRLYDFNLSYLC